MSFAVLNPSYNDVAGLDPEIHAELSLERIRREVFVRLTSAWTTGSGPAVTRKGSAARTMEFILPRATGEGDHASEASTVEGARDVADAPLPPSFALSRCGWSPSPLSRGGMKKTFVPLFDIFGSVRTGARRPLPDFFLPKSETSDFGRGEASFCFVTPPSASLPSLNRR
jgi:hypothetical protein